MLNMSTADSLLEAQQIMPALTVDDILDFEDEWALGAFIDIRAEMWFESLAVQDKFKLFNGGHTQPEAAKNVRIAAASENILQFMAVEART